VLLDAPDTVLIERANGKRIDPDTGGNLIWTMVGERNILVRTCVLVLAHNILNSLISHLWPAALTTVVYF